MTTEKLEDVIHQRDVLMKAISDLASKVGITCQDISHDGPMCLMILDDILNHIKYLEEKNQEGL